jgi:carbon-monoxide dehydrogenase large subunit
MSTKYIGQSIKRVEDKRFITGKGRYTDDIQLPGMLYAYILRSPYAHAKILNIDTTSASKMAGVVKIYTGKDFEAVNGVPCGWQVNFKDGTTMREPKHPLLVVDKVKHAGDGIAMVIASDKYLARDAADEIKIKWEVLPSVTNPMEAMKAGAPKVHDEFADNMSFDWQIGNPKACGVQLNPIQIGH